MASIIEVFGNCRVVEQIASGPLTDVYHALQEPLGRHVALKALRPTIAPTSPFAAHLAREAELLAALHHENILELYDFVRTEDAMWLVLEYIDGVSFAEVLEKAGRLDALTVAAIGVEVARALSHAHERGIIHRDIKPSNILVSKRGRIKLVDFGIAHDDRVPSSPEPLEAGSTFGTPAYMSPEQILGEPIDPRTDVFSLGIVLYQLLAGVRPFDAPDTKATAQRIRHSDPPPLSASVSRVPRPLERIIFRCLEKVPSDRFASAREVAQLLDGFVRGETASTSAELITAELVRAKILDAVAKPRDTQVSITLEAARASLWPAARGYFAILLLALGGGVVIQQARKLEDDTSGKKGALELMPTRPGFLRVVARPWAEVIVDGQKIDTTPFARPIPLAGGTHYVTLKHPKAPEERRVIKVIPAESVLLDVTLGVKGLAADAGPEKQAASVTIQPEDAGAATP